jgi:hypothetical protein
LRFYAHHFVGITFALSKTVICEGDHQVKQFTAIVFSAFVFLATFCLVLLLMNPTINP